MIQITPTNTTADDIKKLIALKSLMQNPLPEWDEDTVDMAKSVFHAIAPFDNLHNALSALVKLEQYKAEQPSDQSVEDP